MSLDEIAGKMPVHLDNRGLTPPNPMMRVLEHLQQISSSQYLLVHNDRKPMFLYPHLDELGYSYFTEVQADGSVIITIWQGDKESPTKVR